MNDHHSQTAKQAVRYSRLAFAFMVCGACLSALALATSFDSATRPWDSVSSVLSVDTAEKMQALAATRPGPTEWPLAVARTRAGDEEGISNRYTVQITPIRGTALLRIDVIGRSPERTTALGHWLTGYFARDLAASFASHNIEQPHDSATKSLVIQPPGQASPLRLHPGKLVLSLISPLLLLLNGIVLYRVIKANRPKT